MFYDLGDMYTPSRVVLADNSRYGKYHFETVPLVDQQPSRPLRQPSILKA